MVTKDTRTTDGRPPSTAPGAQPLDADDDLSIEYPSSDGEPMAESELQFVPLTDTVIILKIWFAHRPDVYAAGDMLVYYRMNDNGIRVAPDVFVVFDAAGNHPRDSWIVWREGKGPDFVMEIASPSTWEWDAEGKRSIYAGLRVTEYWRFDPTSKCFTPPLVGETLSGGQYQELPLQRDGAGTIWSRSELLGLDICVLPGLELRLYDPAGGQWLLTPIETEAALQASESARQALEDENERLREQLRALQSGQ